MCGGGSLLGAVLGAGLAYATGGTSLMLEGAMAGTMAGGLSDQADAASKAADMQNKASQQASDAATKAASQADQAFNAQNAKQPDIQGLQSSNSMAAKGGVSGTMLTGPQGIDPKTLMLGRTSLLGS